MAQAISIDAQTAQDILSALRELKKEVARLREKITVEPPYGSDAWWKWAEKKADEDIKTGRYKAYKNVKELIKDLHAGE